MAILKKIKRELKDCVAALKKLPVERRKWGCFYFLDLIWCEIKYGTHPEDYISLWFWNDMKPKDRKLWLTSGNRKKFAKKFYTKDAFDLLGNKLLFNRKYKEFLKRDWIYSEDSSEHEIKDFVESHKRVIVKPVNQSCGEGVEVFQSADIKALIEKVRGGGCRLLCY